MLKHHKRRPFFAQTSDDLIFSASKVERAATTDLSWLSMYGYKKDRTQRGPLKGCWPGAQRDENTYCRVCQWVSSSIPAFVRGCAVDHVLRWYVWIGWRAQILQMWAAAIFYFLHCIFTPTACPTHNYDTVDPVSGELACRSESPLQILPN